VTAEDSATVAVRSPSWLTFLFWLPLTYIAAVSADNASGSPWIAVMICFAVCLAHRRLLEGSIVLGPRDYCEVVRPYLPLAWTPCKTILMAGVTRIQVFGLPLRGTYAVLVVDHTDGRSMFVVALLANQYATLRKAVDQMNAKLATAKGTPIASSE
jgi:hypothetical protein